MKPIINLEENIGKTVGRRTAPRDALRYGFGVQRTGVELGKALKVRFVPRGVFRFHSHEEADAWMMKHITRQKRS